jgi:Mg-chelatase subunit ChlD
VTKPNSTLIVAVVDRSGSMSPLAADTIGGFNRFLADQKALAGECRFTTVLFDHETTVLYRNVLAIEVEPLNTKTYVPRGSTALLDALGLAIDSTGKELSFLSEDQRPSSVIVLVITDGQENASSKYTYEQIAEKTKHQQEKYSWSFLYLGANQDAIRAGAQLGIAAQNSLTYVNTGVGLNTVYQTISRNIGTYTTTGNVQDLNFTDQQRVDNLVGLADVSDS